MSKVITVFDLYLACKEQVEKGHGEKQVFLSRDDEGNGFHPLWYGFNAIPDSIQSFAKTGSIDGVAPGSPCDNIVLLG